MDRCQIHIGLRNTEQGISTFRLLSTNCQLENMLHSFEQLCQTHSMQSHHTLKQIETLTNDKIRVIFLLLTIVYKMGVIDWHCLSKEF